MNDIKVMKDTRKLTLGNLLMLSMYSAKTTDMKSIAYVQFKIIFVSARLETVVCNTQLLLFDEHLKYRILLSQSVFKQSVAKVIQIVHLL